ncbi:PIN domain-containing protein, partial [bacterium]
LDTNIIIDGRLADICKTGFIEGPIYVPQFVLEEVQYVADSSDSMRRARGRRGLDVLNAMREMTTPQIVGGTTVLVPVVHVLNDISLAVQKISAVDSKLVALAKEKNGSIITNDFNLNKVAELQGVQVLNLNELAQALKPVVLPGEEMQITIVKEGKEPTQGVGYLEDGTMVVVGDGAEFIGETCRVTISSVYQTVAGKMIFAEMRDRPVKQQTMKTTGDDLFDNGNSREKNDDFRHRPGGGMRRKGRA